VTTGALGMGYIRHVLKDTAYFKCVYLLH